MDNSQLYAVIFYFLTFRLTLLFIGGLSIVLGYRLFIKGFFRTPEGGSEGGGGNGGGGAEMQAQAGNVSLSLKGAAPGTFFAAFGAFVITALIMSAPPQFDLKREQTSQAGEVTVSSLSARGEEDADPGLTPAQLQRLADSYHQDAWQAYDEKNYSKALSQVTQAIEIVPGNPEYLDSAAAFAAATSNYPRAVEYAEAARQLAPRHQPYQEKLEQYKAKLSEQN